MSMFKIVLTLQLTIEAFRKTNVLRILLIVYNVTLFKWVYCNYGRYITILLFCL